MEYFDPSGSTYTYCPLQYGEIRLLVIKPAQTATEPVDCALWHRRMPTARGKLQYQALSYAWGITYPDGSHLTHCISCEGKTIRVTSNLNGILQKVRTNYAEMEESAVDMPIWIDAIRINQENMQE